MRARESGSSNVTTFILARREQRAKDATTRNIGLSLAPDFIATYFLNIFFERADNKAALLHTSLKYTSSDTPCPHSLRTQFQVYRRLDNEDIIAADARARAADLARTAFAMMSMPRISHDMTISASFKRRKCHSAISLSASRYDDRAMAALAAYR